MIFLTIIVAGLVKLTTLRDEVLALTATQSPREVSAMRKGSVNMTNSSTKDRSLRPDLEEEPRIRRMRKRRGNQRPLRDWGKPLPETIRKQVDQAANFFSNSVRVPAALIAGQAGQLLYKLTDLPAVRIQDNEIRLAPLKQSLRARIYVTLWRVHVLLLIYTVCAQMTSVVLCSTAHSQILDISREEIALEPTALDLIMRHVEFEYVSVRIMFITGLAAFVLAIAVRGIASLGAAQRGDLITAQREVCLMAAFVAMFLSTLCWWIHVYNEDMTHFDNLWELFARFIVHIRLRVCSSLLALSSFTLGIAAFILAWLAVFDRQRQSMVCYAYAQPKVDRTDRQLSA